MAYSKKMLHGMELTSNDFSKVTRLFDLLHKHLSIKGVITGVISGRVFLSSDGRSAVLTSPEGIFLGGHPENERFFIEVNKLLREEILPTLASKGDLDYVLFYPSEENWVASLEVVMKDLLPMKSGRMTLTHNLMDVDHTPDSHVVPVDAEFLSRQDVIGLEDILDEILEGWLTLAAFTDNGFGCAAIQDTDEGPTIISWCLTDWVVGTECELGIETLEDYRGNGWARKTALGALSIAKQRGITKVGWQCWWDNIGSQRTAMSVGFKLLADYPVMFGWNKPLNNLLVNGNHYMSGNAKYGVEPDYARAAWSYAQALDQGWDWKGDAALYWNAACMFYLSGEKERAKHYFRVAVEKGWKNVYQPHYHNYVYNEEDSEEIHRILAGK